MPFLKFVVDGSMHFHENIIKPLFAQYLESVVLLNGSLFFSKTRHNPFNTLPKPGKIPQGYPLTNMLRKINRQFFKKIVI